MFTIYHRERKTDKAGKTVNRKPINAPEGGLR
jgi:hypothetical protein